MQENRSSSRSVRTRRTAMLLPSASVEEFAPRSDLTYRLIEGLTVTDRSVHFSLFSGSIFRNCTFLSIDFTRCDLDGMRVENCRFERCSFEGAELRSSTFAHCRFLETNLETVHILDCTFFRNAFIDCSLRMANMTKSSFEGGHFAGSTLTRSSCTLNKFRAVAFEDVTLGDCTFSYNIVKDCRFSDVRIDVECIGLVYGLSPENLAEVEFLYLGEEQFVPRDENVVDLLMKLYSERKWAVGLMIMRLNFRITSPVYAIQEYFITLWDSLAAGRLLKTDELSFVTDIFDDLRVDSRLPLLSVVQCLEMANVLAEEMAGAEGEIRTREALVRFSNGLSGILYEMMDEFERTRVHEAVVGTDHEVAARAVFQSRPEIFLSDLLNGLAQHVGLPIKCSSRTLDTATGSWIEILHTTVYSMLTLQIFLFLLNGCVIQVTELKARVRVLTNERLPAHFRGLALSAKQELPEHLIVPFRQLMKHAETLPWASDPGLSGFSTSNIQEIQITETERDGGPSPSSIPQG
jgi:uncharacterized protein YjbI with pentapeptide repeats